MPPPSSSVSRKQKISIFILHPPLGEWMGRWLVDGVFNIFQEHRSQFFLPTGKYKYKRMVLEIRNKVTIWITSACGGLKKRKSTLMRILFPSYRTIYLGQEMVFLINLIISRYVSLGAKL